MANDATKIIAILVVAWLIFGQGQQQTPPPPPGNTGGDTGGTTPPPATGNGGCNYAPTFNLRAQDKWDSTLTLSSAHQYKVNGGSKTAFAGTAVSVNKGDKIDVLWGDGNATYFKDIASYTVTACGLNQFPTDGPKLLVGNTTVTIECFDENNDIINDLAQNYTIGSGESATVPCRMKLSTSKKGLPHGGVLVAEIATGTVYKEADTALAGSKIGTKTDVPGSFTLAAAANKAVAYNVESIVDTGYYPFTTYVAAESGQNPDNSNDVTLYLFSNDCYENSDTGVFECGVNTEDDTLAGDLQGTEVISVD